MIRTECTQIQIVVERGCYQLEWFRKARSKQNQREYHKSYVQGNIDKGKRKKIDVEIIAILPHRLHNVRPVRPITAPMRPHPFSLSDHVLPISEILSSFLTILIILLVSSVHRGDMWRLQKAINLLVLWASLMAYIINRHAFLNLGKNV